MLDADGRYVIENYARMEPFTSFLPGIAGELGIPLWCFYVNRGQCVTSFGVEDKEHAIMEFFPAHQAYQYTDRVGWRTFIRADGRYFEPFRDATNEHLMRVGMNELTIEERDIKHALFMRVRYFTLPEERAAALARTVTLRNEGDAPIMLEMLDGMPALLPYGLSLHSAKHMTQTAKAWMQAEGAGGDMPCFRLRASMDDTSDVHEVRGVNFASARTERDEPLCAYVDPRHVFGYDTSLDKPLGFLSLPFDEWRAQQEVAQNALPCCFFARRVTLAPGEECAHTIWVGQAESAERARAICRGLGEPGVLELKHRRALELPVELTQAITTVTSDPVFDMYCRQTYLDNLLRGGVLTALPGGKLAHLYARKHGDPERDYNAFRVRAEYYSQGNGNFRDVNQNRRCDVLFAPVTGESDLRLFFDLLQLDGYNPLVVECEQFELNHGDRDALLALVSEEYRDEARALLSGAFTPGALRMAAEDWRLANGVSVEAFFARALEAAQGTVCASFGEGYWSDHWTYDLDQLESYLAVYPEREEAVLFYECFYSWYDPPAAVLPRTRRYIATDRGVRQYRFLEKREPASVWLRGADGKAIKATLMEKLLTLCAVKVATLDPFGMGVEMEGGKPGWYDALNGLPGLLGSSMPETLELCRVLRYMSARLERFGHEVVMLAEVAAFAREIANILKSTRETWSADQPMPEVWRALNDAREAYRARVYAGVGGAKERLAPDELRACCDIWLAYVERAIDKARALGDGLCPTYFAYDVTAYEQDEAGLHPTAFRLQRMPDFLEAQVRLMRLDAPRDEKLRQYQAVRESPLYDRELRMYKVNAALGKASYEIGRAHAFTPGWLENESVWLHMEYKYLLELLRARLYEPFFEDLHAAAVPFLRLETYGRSTLENSSFIASSANPDKRIHGKGFVARLSGSTAEFLSIWQIMMIGETPFELKHGVLELALSPSLPEYLTEGRQTIEATLLGGTRVVYHIEPGRRYIPGEYGVSRCLIRWADGQESEPAGGALRGEAAERVRDGQASAIELWLNGGSAV